MIFYRLMSNDEYKKKKIHNNKRAFDDTINTHQYIKGKNYIHLFLNAESCFESFDRLDYTSCVVGQFDIPDEIVCKYGIGLGGYDFAYNNYNTNFRYYDYHNVRNNYCFWLPEIAILEEDFNYDWCLKITKAGKSRNKGYLPFDFETDLVWYREIINDGYLLGYNNKEELLKKYDDLIKTKKKMIKILKNNKRINIEPKDLNNDSLEAAKILVDYTLKNQLISRKDEIYVSIKEGLIDNAINITTKTHNQGNYVVINKNHKHTNPSFCAMLDILGINIDKNILYSITPDQDVIIDPVLIKK